ncbi:hypothetical protein SVA_1984 [Sulfurifustis variabilis]|uniref:Uncharacterized protein n=1 Tax=Sulfurifustis variabilis TaxID=1675686 RepID=A0A1B4V4R4_9GAMM|nr:hypothetical protein [Sulfurifustis variabilis]BAU48536.1 hypothetical protein SVA_1984 [Sulfurifustis variabilis]
MNDIAGDIRLATSRSVRRENVTLSERPHTDASRLRPRARPVAVRIATAARFGIGRNAFLHLRTSAMSRA